MTATERDDAGRDGSDAAASCHAASVKLGALFGKWVDASIAHAEAHCCPETDGKARTVDPTPSPEITSATVVEDVTCDVAWTDEDAQVKIQLLANVYAELATVQTFFVRAGENMTTQPTAARPLPPQVAPGSSAEITITMMGTQARGLYLGALRATTGVKLGPPVVIYVHDIQ